MFLTINLLPDYGRPQDIISVSNMQSLARIGHLEQEVFKNLCVCVQLLSSV